MTAMSNLVYPNAVADHALGQARRPLPADDEDHSLRLCIPVRFEGRADNRVQDVVEISMEGVFVALSSAIAWCSMSKDYHALFHL